MAARKTKLTVDWIVTTTGHGSEAGGDPTASLHKLATGISWPRLIYRLQKDK